MVYQLVFVDSRPPRNVLCFGQTQPSLLPPPVLRLGRAILAIRARRAEPSSVSGPRPGGWGLSPLGLPSHGKLPRLHPWGRSPLRNPSGRLSHYASDVGSGPRGRGLPKDEGAGTAVQRDAACHPEHDAPFAQLFIHSHVADT